jgi:hypothetical protein
MEDDARCAIPPSDCADVLRNVMTMRADVVNLGPAYMNGKRFPLHETSPRPERLGTLSEAWLVPIKYASLAHAILVMPHFAECYARSMADSPSTEPADDAIRSFMEGKCLRSVWPIPFWQRPGSSDISGSFRDMDAAMRSSDALMRFVIYRDVTCRLWTSPHSIRDRDSGAFVRPEDVLIATFPRAAEHSSSSRLAFLCPPSMPTSERSRRAAHCLYAASHHRIHSVCIKFLHKDVEYASPLEKHDISVGVGKIQPPPSPPPPLDSPRIARFFTATPSSSDKDLREHGFLVHTSLLLSNHIDVPIIPLFIQ